MFYADYAVAVHKVLRRLAIFATHYDVCDGSQYLESISFNDIAWC